MKRILMRKCRWGCGFEDAEPRLFDLRPADVLPCPRCGRPVNVRKVDGRELVDFMEGRHDHE